MTSRRAQRRGRPEPPRLLQSFASGEELWQRGRVLFLLGSIPDDAPEQIKEGLARRRQVSLFGRCPCGARVGKIKVSADGISHAPVLHEADCLAGDDNLIPLIDAWRAAQ